MCAARLCAFSNQHVACCVLCARADVRIYVHACVCVSTDVCVCVRACGASTNTRPLGIAMATGTGSSTCAKSLQTARMQTRKTARLRTYHLCAPFLCNGDTTNKVDCFGRNVDGLSVNRAEAMLRAGMALRGSPEPSGGPAAAGWSAQRRALARPLPRAHGPSPPLAWPRTRVLWGFIFLRVYACRYRRTLELYLDSNFCLQPKGDTPSRRGTSAFGSLYCAMGRHVDGVCVCVCAAGLGRLSRCTSS